VYTCNLLGQRRLKENRGLKTGRGVFFPQEQIFWFCALFPSNPMQNIDLNTGELSLFLCSDILDFRFWILD
jgi:hypothetical protein